MAGSDLHLPDGPPRAAAVVLHPHPGMGGNRHHPLVVAVADGLAGAGIAALRPDLPDPDPQRGAAALDELATGLLDELGVDRLLLVGYSWGAAVSARSSHPRLVARVLVAPPSSMLDEVAAPATPTPTPTLVLVPAHDQFGPPDAVEPIVAGWPDAALEVVAGCDHFLAGAVARIADRAVAWSVER